MKLFKVHSTLILNIRRRILLILPLILIKENLCELSAYLPENVHKTSTIDEVDITHLPSGEANEHDSETGNDWVWIAMAPFLSILFVGGLILSVFLIRYYCYKSSMRPFPNHNPNITNQHVSPATTEMDTPIAANSANKKSAWKSVQPLELSYAKPHGTGAFSNVYKAKCQLIPERYFAIKKIPIYNALKHLQWDIHKVFREVENLCEIDNENVVKLHNWWVEDPKGKFIKEDAGEELQFHEWSSTQDYFMFVQMEFCDSTLREWLTVNETVEMRLQHDVNDMLSQIINGLRAIHEKNIIHRDIKPNNIFHCGDTDLWKIGDFGLSTKLNDSNEELTIIGCQSYRSPEMAESNPNYGFKTDVFSLGLTFLEIIYKFPCFFIKTRIFDDLRNSMIPLENLKLEEKVSKEIIQLISNMLVINPDDRIDIFNPIIDTLLDKINVRL